MTDLKHEIPRFDARLVSDVCGNKDVVMRESHDGLFVRYEDVQERIDQLTAERDAALWEQTVSRNKLEMAIKQNAGIVGRYQAQLHAALREVERLKAPVSDEEWGKGCHLATRSHVNNIIANRQRTSHDRH